MPKKPMAVSLGMKPMTPHVEPGVSSGHQDEHMSNQHGHGVITGREMESISRKLNHKLGEKRGAEVIELLEKNMRGGVLKERRLDWTLHRLERNHHDDIRERDIDKLKDIVDSKL